MKVLSLFDGIATGRLALERAGIKIERYYASEIDKYAIKIALKNFPDIVQLGDVRNLKIDFQPDLLIGGSPCQDLSISKKNRCGLQGERSSLFWEYVRILQESKPKCFIFENVASMPKKDKRIISNALGIEPIVIDAEIISAQKRKRLFWVGKLKNEKYNRIEVRQPEKKEVLLKDILIGSDIFCDVKKAYCLDANYYRGVSWEYYKKKKKRQLVIERGKIRKLTPVECERLQGFPDNYTEGISNTQRYKCLGNAFHVEVIVHILNEIYN